MSALIAQKSAATRCASAYYCADNARIALTIDLSCGFQMKLTKAESITVKRLVKVIVDPKMNIL